MSDHLRPSLTSKGKSPVSHLGLAVSSCHGAVSIGDRPSGRVTTFLLAISRAACASAAMMEMEEAVALSSPGEGAEAPRGGKDRCQVCAPVPMRPTEVRPSRPERLALPLVTSEMSPECGG